MPTSETGTWTSSRSRAGLGRARGFTLMEIMVVVAIVALVSVAFLINFNGRSGDSALEETAQRLSALFDYVREQAELQTRDYGFRVTGNGYSFVVFDILANQWRPADEDDSLRERNFPEGIQPQVVVEGRAVVLDSRQREKGKDTEDFTPQIMIFANGDLSSFEISLRREGAKEQARIYSDEQSEIRLLLPGEEEQKGPPVRTAATR
jgi:general secretion pathway protein H